MVDRPAESAPRPLHTAWDETRNVIIVGSGFAGFVAAIETQALGADTLILEKIPKAGSNSAINSDMLVSTGCPQQVKLGIDDSPAILAKDMLATG